MEYKCGVYRLLIYVGLLLLSTECLAVDYGAPFIQRHFVAKRAAWGLFPLGYWSVRSEISQEWIDQIKTYNFNSLIIRNDGFRDPSFLEFSRELNKLIVVEPAPVRRVEGDPAMSFVDFNVLTGNTLFWNTQNVSFMLAEEPFEVSLYDPARGQGSGTRVGILYDPNTQRILNQNGWQVTIEDLYVNGHLFLYGYTKQKAEEVITSVAKYWTAVYEEFNRYSYNPSTNSRPPTFIDVSGAASKRPLLHLIVRKILDKVIRENSPSAFDWVDEQPIPTVQAMEKLAKWQAYVQISGLNAEMKKQYESKLKEAFQDFQQQIRRDVINSLTGASFLKCFFDPECSFFVWLEILGIGPFTDLLKQDPAGIVLQYLDQVPAWNLEILEPYDILFREFQRSGVQLDGVLTHLYPLRDSHRDIYVDPGKELPDKYSGFPFQGRGEGTLLSFKNNRDLITYVSRPVGLSAITGAVQTVRDNLDKHNYSRTPVYFVYQMTGSGSRADDILHNFGATDPRKVNSDEIRAMLNVAYLSGANGAFGWTDCWRKYERDESGKLKTDGEGQPIVDYNAGLFNASGHDGTIEQCTEQPAIDESGKPRLEGLMWAETDVWEVENYLEWAVGPNRTVHILEETFHDDTWMIKLKFEEKPGSEFWAIMNRRTSDAPREYSPSAVRTMVLSTDRPRYVRPCRFPAGPSIQAGTSFSFELSPGEFAMFELSDTPLAEARYLSIVSPQTPSQLFRDRENNIQIDFTPDEITPTYTVRVSLEESVFAIADRIFLYETTITTTGPQSLRFRAPIPLKWPVSDEVIDGGNFLLTVEKPGMAHPEQFRIRVEHIDSPERDTDGDGLTDYEEINRYHTLAGVPDTDSDGMTDGAEVAFWGDRWAADLDGDGLINLLDPDADGDKVKDGADVFPDDPSRWAHDITPMLTLLLLSPVEPPGLLSDAVECTNCDDEGIPPFTVDSRPCTPGTIGTLRTTPAFRNSSTVILSRLFFEVVTLTPGGTVCNADGGPGGRGARVFVPGTIGPDGSFGVVFEIGLTSWDPLTFEVDLFGHAE